MPLKRTWNSRPPKPLQVRRVVGASMLPALPVGQLVYGTAIFRRIVPGNIVIIKHDGKEKIKRVAAVRGDFVYVLGDNADASTDSRNFGWLPLACVSAKVVWPRDSRHSTATTASLYSTE